MKLYYVLPNSASLANLMKPLPILCRYRLRSKVEVENASDDFSCWQRFGERVSSDNPSTEEPEASSVGWGQGLDQTGESAAQGTEQGWQWFTDPRLNSLGFRGIFPSNTTRKRNLNILIHFLQVKPGIIQYLGMNPALLIWKPGICLVLLGIGPSA